MNAQENTITAGDNGIQVSNGGKVTVTARGENGNHITAKNTGIYIEGKNSSVDIGGQITKIQAAASDSGDVFGIDMSGGTIDLKQNGTDIVVEASTANGNATGIHLTTKKEYGEAYLHTTSAAGDVTISADSKTGGSAVGIKVEGGSVFDLSADSVFVQANAESKSITSSNPTATPAVGIQTSVGGELTIQTVHDITIGARAEDDSTSRNSTGIEVTGNENNSSTVKLSSEQGSISINR